eukprot:4382037-Pleurochrysis_carterae.AAC.2
MGESAESSAQGVGASAGGRACACAREGASRTRVWQTLRADNSRPIAMLSYTSSCCAQTLTQRI